MHDYPRTAAAVVWCSPRRLDHAEWLDAIAAGEETTRTTVPDPGILGDGILDRHRPIACPEIFGAVRATEDRSELLAFLPLGPTATQRCYRIVQAPPKSVESH